MGFFDSFVPRKVEAAALPVIDVDAALQPYYSGQAPLFYISDTTASRAEAMTVPTINRACSIIQTIGSLPMHVRNEGTGERVQPQPRVINQPDPRIAGSVFGAGLFQIYFSTLQLMHTQLSAIRTQEEFAQWNALHLSA